MNDFIKVLKISLYILIPLLVIYFIFIFLHTSTKQDCSDLDSIAGFKFDACYDSGIIFSVGKYSNNNANTGLEIIINGQEYPLDKIPAFGKTEYYKYQEKADKITVEQFLRKNNYVCSSSKDIVIQDCKEEQIPLSVKFNNVGQENVSISQNYTNVPNIGGTPITNKCSSDWLCSGWESCLNGKQKRSCIDKNNCLASTNIPEIEKTCISCKENWACIWSSCEDGFSIPTCEDKNHCGTQFSIPGKIDCQNSTSCIPDISCGEWSECKINYTFTNLGQINAANGFQTRICTDKTGCLHSSIQTQECSLKESVTSKQTIICGNRYIEVYSGNELIGRIKDSISRPDISISLDSSDIKCDSCTNGIRDSEELGIDCGGPCKACKKQQYNQDYISNLFEWIRSLIQ